MLQTCTLLLALAGLLLGPRQGLGQGFALTPARWAVPVGGSASRGFNSPFQRSGPGAWVGESNWTVMDLNGDHRPDLVVSSEHQNTRLPVVLGGVATPHWDVYLNTGSGFAVTPTRWAVPVGGSPATGFATPSSRDLEIRWYEMAKGARGQQHWQTMDLNNDSRPDLVVAGEGNGMNAVVRGGVAAPYWEVYLNTGNGFATTATRWTVPVGGSPTTGFNGFANFYAEYLGECNWNMYDPNGDGRPDLVVDSKGNGRGAAMLGGLTAPYWEVYLNTGAGFATTATHWALPIMSAGSSFDMDGDGRYDLLVDYQRNGTMREALGSTADPYWNVYLNTGTGYGPTATRWALPVSMAAAGGFDGWDPRFPYGSLPGRPRWRPKDMNHDGRLDLVVLSIDNGTVPMVPGGLTTPYWEVYLNTGSGFAATATRWAVPVGGSPGEGFNYEARLPETVPGMPCWSSEEDMNGDGYPDLVVCGRGNGTQSVVLGGVATPYWEVYYGDATGLRPAPPVAYPTIFDQRVTLETAEGVGRAYTILDAMGRSRRQGRLTAARQELELSELAAGLYFVRIEGLETVRIVKQ